jgi:hypothetical protein
MYSFPGAAPIGSVIQWAKSLSNTPSLPDEFVECNGQTLTDSQSPYHTQVIPDLNGNTGSQRFLRGSTSSGATGGVETHRHVACPTNVQPYGEAISTALFCPIYTLNYESNLPQYYTVVNVLRIK